MGHTPTSKPHQQVDRKAGEGLPFLGAVQLWGGLGSVHASLNRMSLRGGPLIPPRRLETTPPTLQKAEPPCRKGRSRLPAPLPHSHEHPLLASHVGAGLPFPPRSTQVFAAHSETLIEQRCFLTRSEMPVHCGKFGKCWCV